MQKLDDTVNESSTWRAILLGDQASTWKKSTAMIVPLYDHRE